MTNTTATVSPAAIIEIKRARAQGHEITFVTHSPEMSPGGSPAVAQWYPGPKEVVVLFADGTGYADFWGEDDGVEAAIERRNDARASEQQWIEDQGMLARGFGPYA